MPKPKPLVCLFAAGLLDSLALVSPSQAAKGDDPAAEIVSIQGVGQFREVEEQPWRSAAMEQDLFQGNFVRTGDYSRMGLLFADRTQIRLNEKTVLQVKQVQPPVPDRGGTILRLNLGRAWTQSRSIPKGLIMETPSATAAIRGTNWEMAVAEDSTSTLTVLSGEVEFYNDYGRVVVGRNEQARAEMGKAPVKTVLVDPRERVQWVTAFEVDPLRHVSLHGGGPEELGKDLRSASGDTADQRVLRGFILADLGRWREAGEELASALDLQPGNGRGLLGMGFVALRGGDPQTALESFDRAAGALGREDGELLALGRAAARLLSGEFTAAREILQPLAADRSRRQPASNLILSDIMIYGGDLEKAMEYVHAGLERFPDSARLYAQLGAINLMTDRALEGRDDVKNALLREPGSVEAWLVLGDIERIEGYGEASRTSYGEAASLKEAEDRAWYG
ncbi:MAG: FecR domain-containing protein, partial [bacterium]